MVFFFLIVIRRSVVDYVASSKEDSTGDAVLVRNVIKKKKKKRKRFVSSLVWLFSTSRIAPSLFNFITDERPATENLFSYAYGNIYSARALQRVRNPRAVRERRKGMKKRDKTIKGNCWHTIDIEGWILRCFRFTKKSLSLSLSLSHTHTRTQPRVHTFSLSLSLCLFL